MYTIIKAHSKHVKNIFHMLQFHYKSYNFIISLVLLRIIIFRLCVMQMGLGISP
ncbi:hypothetical protein HanXRQr2_Chr05g0215481 [Helianthus annuus]|uniref:Uncharacterized protein n=1 Tax=Helianthus annuus TaxID=4232 RepID=A0A9K3IZU8_HELAN|nr:hypothetical protein HanXRQr2_Chr05g0215481 [Helianthus annuus]KAJ0922804.1 hypothetical protein HanPSC8_Chr05g0208041 [Helianthus annuus]